MSLHELKGRGGGEDGEGKPEVGYGVMARSLIG